MKKLQGPSGSAEKIPFARRQARFINRNAHWILLFFLAATAALAPLAGRLQLHANFMNLLPAKHPSIINLEAMQKEIGGTSFVIVVIESPDESAALRAAELFSKRAESFRHVDFVDTRTHSPVFENRKLLFLSLESVKKLRKNVDDLLSYYRRKTNPFYVDLLEEQPPKIEEGLELEEKVSKIGGVSAKEKSSYLQIVLIKPDHPISDFVATREIMEDVRAGFEEVKKELNLPVTMGITGPYRTRYEEYRTITHDLKLTGAIAAVLMVLINLIAFRNFRSVIYAYLPLAVGTIWIWAFTELTIGYLNLITAFLAAILFGMGGDYTFHILVSFEEDLRLSGGDVEKAIEMTYEELWTPLWSSMWTTAVVFYAMIISGFEGFRHFGIIAGFGIVISFVIVLFVQPSLIVLIEKYFPAKRKPSNAGFTPSKAFIVTVIAGGLLFSAFSATHISQMRFNYNFFDLQAKNNDATQLAERVGNYFGIFLNPVVFMTPDREAAARLAGDINRYAAAHPGTYFDFAASINSHVPRDQEAKIKELAEVIPVLEKYRPVLRKLDPEMRKKIQDLEKQLSPVPMTVEDLPDGIRGQYEGKNKNLSAVFIYPAHSIMDGANAQKFVDEARRFPAPEGVRLAGEPVIYADILNLIEKDTPLAVGISAIVVFLLVLIHFRRLDHALWVHAPLALGILWMVGMMKMAGLQFNFFNMVIVPGILGVGIDNGIYIFDRYKARRSENFFESMKKSLKGVMLSSATNLSAFASVMFATHRGMASMGKLGFFGFMGCLLSSVVFIPALIEFFELKYSSRVFARTESSAQESEKN